MCAANVQSLITNAMAYDWELKAFAPDAIEMYVTALTEYMMEMELEFDWNTENMGMLFKLWGFPDLDLTDYDAVINALAHAWAWNVSMNTGLTLAMLFDIF